MNKFFFKRIVLSSLTIILASIIAFWGINNIFFQQDEWLGLGGAIQRLENYGPGGTIAEIFNFSNKAEGARFLPVTSFLNLLVYGNLGLNFHLYGIFMLIIIISSALVLNLVVFKLTKSYLISTLVSIMWVTNNLGYQALSWIGTFVPSVFSVLFFLLGLYFLLLFNEKKKIYLFIISLISIVLSLFSKETSAFYPAVYLLLIWCYFKSNILSKIKLSVLIFIPLVVSIFLPRLIFLTQGQIDLSPPINAASKLEIIYNFFLLPAKTLFHTFLSNAQIYELVYSANRVFFGTQTDGFVVERIIGDAFSLLVAFYILALIAFVLAFSNQENRKIILFSLLSFFASTIPFALFKGNSTIVEQRYYIYPAIFSSLLAVSVIYSLVSKFRWFKSILMVIIFVPILFHNIDGIKKMFSIDVTVGSYRKGMLETVSEVKPNLGSNNVFYFYTDHTGFWEFQSGFGQTLAVWLYDSGKIPREALTDRDFWDLSYEGIKQYDTGKYGYLMTYEKLLNALKENPDVALTEVHAYYWDYQKHTVTNVSSEIRTKIEKDL